MTLFLLLMILGINGFSFCTEYHIEYLSYKKYFGNESGLKEVAQLLDNVGPKI